ncbi:MAG: hypothetical protein KC609_25785 [Myxococcales bacterium]|nr:hypothetical protein [Myxococcales bacterium]
MRGTTGIFPILIIAASLSWAPGCLKSVTIDGRACQTDNECYQGQTCSDGQCVTSTTDDAFVDLEGDTSVRVDGGDTSVGVDGGDTSTGGEDVEDTLSDPDAADINGADGTQDATSCDCKPSSSCTSGNPSCDPCSRICLQLENNGCLPGPTDMTECKNLCTADKTTAQQTGTSCNDDWKMFHNCCAQATLTNCLTTSTPPKGETYTTYCAVVCGTQYETAKACVPTATCTAGSCSEMQVCKDGSCVEIASTCDAIAPAPTSACTTNELGILAAYAPQTDEDKNVRACVGPTGQTSDAEKSYTCCFAEATGVSLACSTCWGIREACIRSQCTACNAAPGTTECTNCITETCKPAFDVCTGDGSTTICTPKLPPANDSCQNSGDLALLPVSGIEKLLSDCANDQPPPKPEELVCCVQEKTKLSAECSACYGIFVSCMVGECKAECGAVVFEIGADTDCDNCAASKCQPNRDKCTGTIP